MEKDMSDVQAGFKKNQGTSDVITNAHWIIEKGKEYKKEVSICFTNYRKAFVSIRSSCGIYITDGYEENLSTWPVKVDTNLMAYNQEVKED